MHFFPPDIPLAILAKVNNKTPTDTRVAVWSKGKFFRAFNVDGQNKSLCIYFNGQLHTSKFIVKAHPSSISFEQVDL